jgi:hypothetical protein
MPGEANTSLFQAAIAFGACDRRHGVVCCVRVVVTVVAGAGMTIVAVRCDMVVVSVVGADPQAASTLAQLSNAAAAISRMMGFVSVTTFLLVERGMVHRETVEREMVGQFMVEREMVEREMVDHSMIDHSIPGDFGCQ